MGRAIRKIGRAKAVRPDNIPIELWKCLGEGLCWLTNLFNSIVITGRISDNRGEVL